MPNGALTAPLKGALYIEIYVDIVFAVNFAMDFLILWATAKLLRLKTRLRRIACGAMLSGALYAASLFIDMGGAGFFVSELVLIIALWVCFAPKTARALGQALVTSHIAAFAVGGICMALAELFDTSGVFVRSEGYFSLKLLLGAIAISYVAIKMFHSYLGKRVLSRQRYCSLKIYIGESVVPVEALIDTGNSLSEPFTRRPVVITELTAFGGLLPDGLYGEDNQADLGVLSDISGTIFENRLRLLPYEAIGVKDGMLIGLRSDKVEFNLGESGTKVVENPVIALYNRQLSVQGRYQALVCPEIIDL